MNRSTTIVLPCLAGAALVTGFFFAATNVRQAVASPQSGTTDIKGKPTSAQRQTPAATQPVTKSAASRPATMAATRPSKDTAMPRVRIKTSMGEIVVELDAVKAPLSTENFLQYTRDKHYDGMLFHRVIPGFMIQGGGFDQTMNERPTRPPIKNEHTNGLKNARGTIAMARTPDPDSATAQFYINVNDNTSLDMAQANPRFPQYRPAAYAVFGKVVEGMDVCDKIVAVPARPEPKIGMQPSPITPVIIESVRLITP